MKEESVCIIDDGACSGSFGWHPNRFADWYPSLGVVRFTCGWFDVPDIPVSQKPSEQLCYQWINSHPGWYSRMCAGRARRDREHKARMAEAEARFKREGTSVLLVSYRLPDGQTKRLAQSWGILSTMEGWRAAMFHMLTRLPAGTVLSGFDHRRGLTDKQAEKLIADSR